MLLKIDVLNSLDNSEESSQFYYDLFSRVQRDIRTDDPKVIEKITFLMERAFPKLLEEIISHLDSFEKKAELAPVICRYLKN